MTRILQIVTNEQKGFTHTPSFGVSSQGERGFSLIEIMVSLSLFITVIVISMGSILSVLDANRKSQSLRAVMDNLNFTLESVTRTVRFGQNYHCGVGGTLSDPLDCPSGDSSITVLASDGTQVTYKQIGSQLGRSVDGGADTPITSPDVTITNIKFYVFGSDPYCSTPSASCSTQDTVQPRAIMVVSGFAGTKISTQSSFTIQTTVSQRLFDFQ